MFIGNLSFFMSVLATVRVLYKSHSSLDWPKGIFIGNDGFTS